MEQLEIFVVMFLAYGTDCYYFFSYYYDYRFVYCLPCKLGEQSKMIVVVLLSTTHSLTAIDTNK